MASNISESNDHSTRDSTYEAKTQFVKDIRDIKKVVNWSTTSRSRVTENIPIISDYLKSVNLKLKVIGEVAGAGLAPAVRAEMLRDASQVLAEVKLTYRGKTIEQTFGKALSIINRTEQNENDYRNQGVYVENGADGTRFNYVGAGVANEHEVYIPLNLFFSYDNQNALFNHLNDELKLEVTMLPANECFTFDVAPTTLGTVTMPTQVEISYVIEYDRHLQKDADQKQEVMNKISRQGNHHYLKEVIEEVFPVTLAGQSQANYKITNLPVGRYSHFVFTCQDQNVLATTNDRYSYVKAKAFYITDINEKVVFQSAITHLDSQRHMHEHFPCDITTQETQNIYALSFSDYPMLGHLQYQGSFDVTSSSHNYNLHVEWDAPLANDVVVTAHYMRQNWVTQTQSRELTRFIS